MQHQGRKKQQGFPAGTLVTAETKATGRPKTLWMQTAAGTFATAGLSAIVWESETAHVRLPTSLFYIERDPHSRMEIWERETWCRTRCKQAASSTRADLPSSPPPPCPSQCTRPRQDNRGQLQLHPALPPHPWLKYVIFRVFGQKWGRPLFRGSKVLQLNSDGFCDYVRIWMEVIGHLWAELGFWFFPDILDRRECHGRKHFMGANISWARIFHGREYFDMCAYIFDWKQIFCV